MALNRTEEHLLPCERRLEDLWDRMDSPADEHQRTCPHCQTARASLHSLAEATRALYEDKLLAPPLDLRGRIMAAVRAEVRRGRRLPLPGGEFGPVDVSEQAVAVVLRYAADTVEGVRARRCQFHFTERASSNTAAGWPAEGAGPLRVELSIAIRYSSTTTLGLVEEVRTRVAAAADAQVGLRVAQIDIVVEDIYRDAD